MDNKILETFVKGTRNEDIIKLLAIWSKNISNSMYNCLKEDNMHLLCTEVTHLGSLAKVASLLDEKMNGTKDIM